jgi:hypothetical protein
MLNFLKYSLLSLTYDLRNTGYLSPSSVHHIALTARETTYGGETLGSYGSRPLEQYGISTVQFRSSISEASAPSRGV